MTSFIAIVFVLFVLLIDKCHQMPQKYGELFSLPNKAMDSAVKLYAKIKNGDENAFDVFSKWLNKYAIVTLCNDEKAPIQMDQNVENFYELCQNFCALLKKGISIEEAVKPLENYVAKISNYYINTAIFEEIYQNIENLAFLDAKNKENFKRIVGISKAATSKFNQLFEVANLSFVPHDNDDHSSCTPPMDTKNEKTQHMTDENNNTGGNNSRTNRRAKRRISTQCCWISFIALVVGIIGAGFGTYNALTHANDHHHKHGLNIVLGIPLALVGFVMVFIVFFFLIKYQYYNNNNNNNGSKNGPQEILLRQKNSFAKRMSRLLNSAAHADVKFLVGQGDEQMLLPAHKNILAMASDVFEANFRFDIQKAPEKQEKGPSPEEEATTHNKISSNDGVTVIKVPDVEADAFKVMLKYIYTKDLHGLNAENVNEVIYAAEKYDLKELKEACVAYPEVDPPNAFLAYEEAQFLNEKEMIQKYLTYIDQNAEQLLQSEEFLKIPQTMLIEILERDQLVVENELSIWEAALRWADDQCDENGIKCTAVNRRQMLGQALYKIRFPLIPKDDFESIASSEVLRTDDVIAVYQYHCRPQYFGAMPTGTGAVCGEGHHQRYQLEFSTQNRHYAKIRGTITLVIQQVSQFVQEPNRSRRVSDAVHIRGMAWKMVAQRNGQCMGLSLKHVSEDNGIKRSCACLGYYMIIPQKKEKEKFIYMIPKHTYVTGAGWGYAKAISFKDLMDVDNGWYNTEEDSVTVVVELFVDEPKTVA